MSWKNRIAIAAVSFAVLAVGLIIIVNVRPVAASSSSTTVTVPPVPVLVTNSATQPVPTQSVEAPTTVVFSGPLSLGSTQTFDVSAYRQIRVSIATTNTNGAAVQIRNKDGSFSIPLAEISTVFGGVNFATGVIDLPGRTIEVSGANRDGSTLDSAVIDGR